MTDLLSKRIMKQGTLHYDGQSARCNFYYLDKEGDRCNHAHAGIHCDEDFEFKLNNVWVSPCMEMNMKHQWYLVDLLRIKRDGLEVGCK